MSNRYLQYIQQQEKDKTGWLDPAMTLAGTLAGLPLGPAGMAAGAGLGHAVGGAASSAVNGDATGAIQGASGIPQAWQMFAPYIGTFESGGPVREGQLPLWMQMAAQQAATPQVGPDMAQGRQMLEQFAGPAPTPFQPREASHPTLEMLASIIPQVLESMPKPVKPNNRAIGTWLPAIGTAIGAPAKYAQGKRQAYNEAGQEQYEAQVDARNKRMAAASPSVAGYLTREKKAEVVTSANELDRKMTADESQRITGTSDWEGFTLRQYQARNKPTGTSAMTDIPLTGEALLMEAKNYLRGLPLTSFGRDQKNRVRVLNVAAALRRGEAPNIALTRADYAADRKSLQEMRTNLDSVTAFEKTALKNADVFIAAMESVPDTGVPALNTPIRSLSGSAMGSAEMAAFNAARRTIIPEFARIMSNPRLVGQLTDQSRKEVDEIIAGNATLNQALATLRVLRQDATNRRDAYQSQLDVIRGRLGAGQDGAPQQGGAFKWPGSSLAPTGGN